MCVTSLARACPSRQPIRTGGRLTLRAKEPASDEPGATNANLSNPGTTLITHQSSPNPASAGAELNWSPGINWFGGRCDSRAGNHRRLLLFLSAGTIAPQIRRTRASPTARRSTRFSGQRSAGRHCQRTSRQDHHEHEGLRDELSRDRGVGTYVAVHDAERIDEEQRFAQHGRTELYVIGTDWDENSSAAHRQRRKAKQREVADDLSRNRRQHHC